MALHEEFRAYNRRYVRSVHLPNPNRVDLQFLLNEVQEEVELIENQMITSNASKVQLRICIHICQMKGIEIVLELRQMFMSVKLQKHLYKDTMDSYWKSWTSMWRMGVAELLKG